MYPTWLRLIASAARLSLEAALGVAAIAVLCVLVGIDVPAIICFAAILLIICILLGQLATRYARIERKAEQERRDRLAYQLAAEIERGIAKNIPSRNVPPFALYLRPFCLEEAIRRWKFWDRDNTLFLETGKLNFDYILQEQFSYLDLQLVSIGLPNDQEGSGHIVTGPASWQQQFRQLAERAKTIVMVPGMQNGVLSEIRWLRVTGLLVNTVLFKPAGYPKAEWQKMKEFYEDVEDIEFPDYSTRQLSFRMSMSGRYFDLLTWPGVYQRGASQGLEQLRTVLAGQNRRESMKL